MDPAPADIVAGLRRGEASAFDRAYEGHAGRVYGYLVRLCGRRDLAEDLLQETFMRLADHARRLREDTDLAAWLFAVATNAFRSHRRAMVLDGFRIERLVAAGLRGAAVEDPEAIATGNQTQRRLEVALAALPVKYREAVLLVAVEGLEPAAAATIAGVRPDAFRQRLARGRALLEAALDDGKRGRTR